MKPRHAAALALVLLASCAPDMTTINSANERAERAAERAKAAQLQAERYAELAAEAVKRTKSADYIEYEGGGAAFGEGSSEWWAMRAQDAVTRMCAACDTCRLLTGAARERYEEYQAVQYEACSGHPWPYPIQGLSK